MIKTIVYSYFKTTQMEDGVISLALLTLIHYEETQLPVKHKTIWSQQQAWCSIKEDVERI